MGLVDFFFFLIFQICALRREGKRPQGTDRRSPYSFPRVYVIYICRQTSRDMCEKKKKKKYTAWEMKWEFEN